MKDKNTAGILGILLGGIGVHKFYLGQTGMGILYVLLCWTGLPALAGLIEGIILLTMTTEAFNARYNGGLALPGQLMMSLPAPPAPPPIVVNVAQQVSPGGSGSTVAAQLKQLHELKVAGALTDAEFDSEKQKLLSGR